MGADTYMVNKPRRRKAAADLRQPFWNQAKNPLPCAEVIFLPQVTIAAPGGKRTKVDNPLFHYAFHPIGPTFLTPYSRCRRRSGIH
ncbi:hypothetical protein LXA43DRAFT_96181 [Ganoderma leucocontextum]|nr:hypothetical protein LXA43DRAFT_96181 [Ganoderma leucocontextum]